MVQTPVAYIVFNRPAHTAETFAIHRFVRLVLNQTVGPTDADRVHLLLGTEYDTFETAGTSSAGCTTCTCIT